MTGKSAWAWRTVGGIAMIGAALLVILVLSSLLEDRAEDDVDGFSPRLIPKHLDWFSGRSETQRPAPKP